MVAQLHGAQIWQARFLVLDEVDRMVEAGHFRELRSLLHLLEKARTE